MNEWNGKKIKQLLKDLNELQIILNQRKLDFIKPVIFLGSDDIRDLLGHISHNHDANWQYSNLEFYGTEIIEVARDRFCMVSYKADSNHPTIESARIAQDPAFQDYLVANALEVTI